MARLDEHILGYYCGKVDTKDVSRLINTLLRLGICSTVTSSGNFTLRRKDKHRFLSCAKSRIRFELGTVRGIYGFFERNSRRYGIFAAIITVIAVFVLTRTLVWDVRISGNTTLSEDAVEDTLNEHGLKVGSPWRRVDKSLIEATLLSEHPEIAWISLNRRGTVAYVELIESENVGRAEEVAPIYSNVVAECDGVIEEITVKSGEAVVKVGDVVKAGDVLISGVVEGDGGVRFCRAQGTVIARTATDISAEASRQVTEMVESKRRIAHVRVLIFNFSINIFKNYRNSDNTCDIIEKIRNFALFDGKKLPISIVKVYEVEYTELTRTRSDAEMVSEAKAELDGKIRDALKDADVLKLRTDGEFLSDTYRLTTRVVYAKDIGKESAIEIS